MKLFGRRTVREFLTEFWSDSTSNFSASTHSLLLMVM